MPWRTALPRRAWRPGTSIPNEGELAREFGVSPGTMRKALDLIEGERLVTRRQGRGTFVNDQASDELAIRFSNIRGADGERIVGSGRSRERSWKAEPTNWSASACDCVPPIRSTASAVFNPTPASRSWSRRPRCPATLFPGLRGEERCLASDRGPWHNGTEFCWARRRSAFRSAGPLRKQQRSWALRRRRQVLALDRVTQTLDGCPVEWRVGQCHLLGQHYLAEMT